MLRGLPSLGGTFTGTYAVTSCSQSGQAALADICDYFPIGALWPYTFNFTQSVDVVSGRFFLDTIEFDNLSGTIGLGGNLILSARAIDPWQDTIDVTWNLGASQPNQLGGDVGLVWFYSGLGINGSISTVNKTASVP